MTVRGAQRLDDGWLLTMRHVADRLNVSYRTVERMVANGDLAHVRVGPLVRIDPRDLRAYLEARHQEAVPPPSLVSPSSANRRAGQRRVLPSRAARPSFLDELEAVER